MPSTYTTNNGIEKIATGEQSGTWGTTTNVNFDLLDEALDGQVSRTVHRLMVEIVLLSLQEHQVATRMFV